MTEADNIILEHLLHIRSTLDEIQEDMREFRRPVGALENMFWSMSARLDRIESRIARVERRLELNNCE